MNGELVTHTPNVLMKSGIRKTPRKEMYILTKTQIYRDREFDCTVIHQGQYVGRRNRRSRQGLNLRTRNSIAKKHGTLYPRWEDNNDKQKYHRKNILHIAAPTHFGIKFVTSTNKNIITVEKRFI